MWVVALEAFKEFVLRAGPVWLGSAVRFLIAVAAAASVTWRRPRRDPWGYHERSSVIGRTLSLYLSERFARTVIASFFVVFVLIYSVDLVELLLRSGDYQLATGILMAGLSFLRSPTLAEQALPFAVLFGSMIAFLNLSRKMELVVARAAGVRMANIDPAAPGDPRYQGILDHRL